MMLVFTSRFEYSFHLHNYFHCCIDFYSAVFATAVPRYNIHEGSCFVYTLEHNNIGTEPS